MGHGTHKECVNFAFIGLNRGQTCQGQCFVTPGGVDETRFFVSCSVFRT